MFPLTVIAVIAGNLDLHFTSYESFPLAGSGCWPRTVYCINSRSIISVPMHPLLKKGYTGHEKTYSGDVDISPGLAESKQNQQFLEKSDLPIFLGSSRFFLN